MRLIIDIAWRDDISKDDIIRQLDDQFPLHEPGPARQGFRQPPRFEIYEKDHDALVAFLFNYPRALVSERVRQTLSRYGVEFDLTFVGDEKPHEIV